MNLKNKKRMIARVLGVGAGRIKLDNSRLSDVKDIITRQDARELLNEKIVKIREIGGRRKKEARKTRKRQGKIKKTLNTRKKDYVRLTRKLRKHISSLKQKNKISREKYKDLRTKIRSKNFKSLSHLQENLRSEE